ncbi:MAG: hypothetical protein ABS76_01630 [Pelagibacterium sp. SCN 64-44]|nr:MAG: hypothetical protein ABS76_01630 [Pelagibacterium sp. SCN 64-44]
MPTLWRANRICFAVLNRIYIIVGMLAIIVLGGAFIAPHFVRWSDYRLRMEELASNVLGTPVTVRGDIEFSLLPQPRLAFSNVLVGSPEEPAATVDSVEAEFSLMDFLRDNYAMTRLVLRGPVVDFTVDESGFLGSGVTLSEGNGGVALGQTSIENGTFRLADRRRGEFYTLDGVSGELRLSSFGGPLSFQGSGRYKQDNYALRFNSGAADAGGNSRVSAFLQPRSGEFSLSVEGLFTAGMAPKFDGGLIFRQKPPAAEAAADIRGDLVFESKLTASTDRLVLSGYTLQPDENRAGTRLTGAASVQLGERLGFDAVISGGVFSLPPRDATEDASTLPYEAVRLLSELPAPPLPPLPGRVGVDLAEMGLRGFALRNVRLDATTDGRAWEIEQFIASLPGDTEIRANGQLSDEGGHPGFRGKMALESRRLDGLAALWRKAGANNPLFNQPGGLKGTLMLGRDALGLSAGVATLAGRSHGVEIRLGFGEEKRLDLVGNFDALGAEGSRMLAALLPGFNSDPVFAVSFPQGSFSLSGKAMEVFGIAGEQLVAEGQWGDGRIDFSRLSAGDWGGVGFDARLVASGTLAAPVLSGSGRVRAGAANAPALLALYDRLGVTAGWRAALAPSLPAEVLVDLSFPDDSGAQLASVAGKLGVGELNFRADLGGGLAQLTTGSLRLVGGLESDDIAGLTRQLGLGETPLFSGDGSMLASFSLDGAPANSLESRLTLSLGDESLGFSGNLSGRDDGDMQGTGTLTLRLDDAGGLARLAGFAALGLPPASGKADVHFEGLRLLRATNIEGNSGNTGFSGEISLTRTGEAAAVSGALEVDRVSAEGLAAAFFGPAALVGGDGLWPEGPLAGEAHSRPTRGSIAVVAQSLEAGGVERLGRTGFELGWDETRMRLARFEARRDQGVLGLDVTLCCAGPLAERTVSGRVSLAEMELAAIAPPALADALEGRISGGVQFEGSGASLAEVLAGLAGEGNFTLADLAASGLSPNVFPAVARLEGVLDMAGEDLGTVMALALQQGAFAAPIATGAFSLAGGVARIANLIIDGDGGQLSGSFNLGLATLGLNGTLVLTPRDFTDANGLVSSDISRILLHLGGSLIAPQNRLDLEEMIAAIMVRANEIEVDRLEALRLEEEARQRAAAEERNRLIREERQRAAEEAARRAAEEEARRAEEEALQLQEPAPAPVEPAPVESPAPLLPGPLTPGYQFPLNPGM